jgi:hypothetical protein
MMGNAFTIDGDPFRRSEGAYQGLFGRSSVRQRSGPTVGGYLTIT